MAISFTGLYNQTHQFAAGTIAINTPFVGNLLAIELTTKPEYVPNTQVIGYLYQHYQTSSKGYALRSGKDVISLELPETDSLTFIPTPYLSDSYTLSLRYAIAGAFVEQSNTAPIPQNILLLPNQVLALDLQLETIEQGIQDLNDQIPTWDTLTGKPSTFAPSSHTHTKAQITDLSLDWADITGKPATFAPSSHTHTKAQITDLSLDWVDITGKPSTFAPSSHTHTIEQIQGLSIGKITLLLSANTTLESRKAYLATVDNLICTLPANPVIGDWIELSNGNFASFRVNHGNESQTILNNQSATTAGASNGIILKPYGFITLVFVGGNLWISVNKHRTTNNFLGTPIQSSTQILPYTASALESYTFYDSNNGINKINDGNKIDSGVMKTGGGTPNELRILATFSQTVLITKINYWLGQFNGPFNPPTSLDFYRNNQVQPSNLLGSQANLPLTGSLQIENTIQSTQYAVNFKSNSNNISILELELIGIFLQSGEISVI